MPRPVDKHAVDQLVVKHLPATLSFAQRLTGNADVAEDVVQEALCRVLRRWKSYRGESEFSTWMMQIVVNVDRDRRRSRRPSNSITDEQVDASLDNPNEQLVAVELSERVQMIVQKLPDRQREVALLCMVEGRSTEQVAEILQTTPANVHTCLHLARKHLATALGIDHSKPKST